MAPSDIKIFLKLNNNKIALTDVEPFTLSTFKDLIIDSFEANVDLLIGRVRNKIENRTSGTKLISSFYCANSLNRILFKYDSSRHLLHKIMILNPTNNLPILGKIDYFKVIFDETLLQCLYLNNFSAKNVEMRNTSFYYRNNTLIIKAEKFASDEDFFNNHETREYFRKNCEKDDMFLFEVFTLPEETTSQGSLRRMGFFIRLLHFNFIVVFVIAVLLVLLVGNHEYKTLIFNTLLFCICSLICMLIYGVVVIKRRV
ncbi:hypothetical protein CDIK_1393 [Cucumispora dikerogammari]|nr:hypothetical protein CDIK_1393 [Cucumispora dikerogammari]